MKKLLCSTALVGLLAVPSLVSAQTIAGPFVAYHDNADFGIGAFVSVPLPDVNENLSVGGSFGYFFPGGASELGTTVDVSYWELNLDGTYTVPIDADVTPFVLAGLNIARGGASASSGGISVSASSTDLGINLGGGIRFDTSDSYAPFVGVKVEAGGGDSFVLFAGLGFQVGG